MTNELYSKYIFSAEKYQIRINPYIFRVDKFSMLGSKYIFKLGDILGTLDFSKSLSLKKKSDNDE